MAEGARAAFTLALLTSVSLTACAPVASPGAVTETQASTSTGPSPTATSLIFVADVVAVADRLPAGDPESSCRGTVTMTLDPTPKGPLKLATARFDIKLGSCAGDTIITDVHVHRGSENNLAIDATISQMTLTSGGGSGMSVNPGVKLTAVHDVIADTAGFYINLHSKRHPSGFMRGELRQGQ